MEWREAIPFGVMILDDLDLRSYPLSKLKLKKSSLRYTNLKGLGLARVNWKEINLEYSQLDGIKLKKSNLSLANLFSASLKDGFFEEVNFKGANLEGADLSQARFKKCNFDKANLKGALLQECHFEKCSFRQTNLSFTDFENACIKGSRFLKTNLYGSTFLGARVEKSRFKKADLSQCSLTEASLSKTKISQGFWPGKGKTLLLTGLVLIFLVGMGFLFSSFQREKLEELREARLKIGQEYRDAIQSGLAYLKSQKIKILNQIQFRLNSFPEKPSYREALKDPELTRLFESLSLVHQEKKFLERKGELYREQLQKLDQLIFIATKQRRVKGSFSTLSENWEDQFRDLKISLANRLNSGIVEKTESWEHVKGEYLNLKKQ